MAFFCFFHWLIPVFSAASSSYQSTTPHALVGVFYFISSSFFLNIIINYYSVCGDGEETTPFS
ncbi:hypothetical protein AAHE18_18G071300 [Arachis hypogaea]